jgi:DNA-binding transcriptional ArsR family regulator
MTKQTTKTAQVDDAAIDHRLLKALGHPLRQRILRVLGDRVASPVELSRELEEPLGNVSYHVKMLEELEAIELVRTAPVRGTLEHFYRATMRVEFDDAHWARLPVSVRRKLFDQTLQMIWDHVVESAEANGLDDERAHVSFTPLELDVEGYDEVVGILADTLERLMEAQASAKGRLAELGDDTDAELRRTEVVMLHFDRA